MGEENIVFYRQYFLLIDYQLKFKGIINLNIINPREIW